MVPDHKRTMSFRGMLTMSVVSWCCGYDRAADADHGTNKLRPSTLARLPAAAVLDTGLAHGWRRTARSSKQTMHAAGNFTRPEQDRVRAHRRLMLRRPREDVTDAGGCDVPSRAVRKVQDKGSDRAAGDGKRPKARAAHTGAPSSGEYIDALATWSSAWDSEGFDKV